MAGNSSEPSPDVNTASRAGAATDALDATRRFTFWAISMLKLKTRPDDDRVYRLDIPEQHRDTFGGAPRIHFTFNHEKADTGNGAAAESPQLVTPQGRLVTWLIQRLRELGRATFAAPAHQPVSIHELTPKLFAAYTIEAGNIHLGGCHLEERPIVRLTYRPCGGTTGSDDRLTHVFAFADGQVVDDDTIRSLRLEETVPLSGRPPKLTEEEIARLVETAKTRLAGRFSDSQVELVAATIIWCNHAEGKLSFVIGERSVDVPFSGWAEMLRQGSHAPPPFTCPHSGIETFQVAATDDGRIAAAEAIATCSESGQRVLESDLENCSVTGKRALPEFMDRCPVTEQCLLRKAMKACWMCREKVSPASLKAGCCQACRKLKRISKSDPRMARLLGEHPGLDHWRSWKLSETTTAYVLVADRLFRRLLVVVDRETLEPRHLATASRLFSGWAELSELERGELLH